MNVDALLVIVLYALALPYLALMLLVCIGLLRERRPELSDARPSVSVVIPARNEADRLEATLSSLCAQRYPGRAEFVIVDDRSSDGTSEIIRNAAARDPRVRRVPVRAPSPRLSPKVNAVAHGIEASDGEIIVTSDADCRFPEGWLEGMVSRFAPGVTMVVGYVETVRAGRARSWLQRFEAIDWLSLMLVSRALTHFGWKFASSANNQAYRRDAFEAVGGFGAAGRAPSGDEDLLAQRLGRLPDSRIVFASAPEVRVSTQPLPSWGALLHQRRRWVSRYHHVLHYHPGFLASIAVLGFQSVLLAACTLLLPVRPALLPWVAGLWVLELALYLLGMGIGTGQLQRRDLWGWPSLAWAVTHPFFIATVVSWSLLRSGAWSGSAPYHAPFWHRRWRLLRRRLREPFGT